MTRSEWVKLLEMEIQKEKDFISSYPDKAYEAVDRINAQFDDKFIRMDFDDDEEEYAEEITSRIDDFIDYIESSRAEKTHYRSEFPYYHDLLRFPESKRAEWSDCSWHNDSCPRIERKRNGMTYTIWQEYRNPDDRDTWMGKRFAFVIERNEDNETILYVSTDEWKEIEELANGID